MDLLKYLEPMKNLPERFSNLAFWRGVRKLRDEVVNAFEYIDSWGESVENTELTLSNRITTIQSKVGYQILDSGLIAFNVATVNCAVQKFGDNMIIMTIDPQTFSVQMSDYINLDNDSIGLAYLGVDVTYTASSGAVNDVIYFPIVLSRLKNLNNYCQVNMIGGIGGLYSNTAITIDPTTRGIAKLYIKRIKK